ncbi:SIR2 family NAD-dependent protein deacylase [Erysipelothrix anatis]|uniref:SIR2 family NAD-dependent protein deacylase n=1 Tax=Erysipelothrix anatis TaxID=2683713 RepID=UPI001357D9FB|nr:Sir2 family NAD-dependent protein deacetylase [Erysipelothrix anatis]
MIIALTGAGISKASGLKTFDEMPEVRQMLNKEFLENNPDAFRNSVYNMHDLFMVAKPNDAHLALAEYGVQILTMNVDGLHEKAGSKPINLHGTIPTQFQIDNDLDLENRPVLYGETAPNYPKGIEAIKKLGKDDILLVIGASEYTVISNDIRRIAAENGAHVIEIQQNAVANTRIVLENLIKAGIQV